MDPVRRRLALVWGGLVLLWSLVTVVIVQPITFLACSSENLELEEGSPKETYCDAIRDFQNSGEPSEWTTPLPYLLPLLLLGLLGVHVVWRRSRRSARRAAVLATAALVVHVALIAVLPG